MEKGRNSRKTIYRVLFAVFVCVFLLSAYKIASTILEYHKSAEIYNDMKGIYYNIQEATDARTPTPFIEKSQSIRYASPTPSASVTASSSPLASPTPEAVYKDPRIKRQAFDALKKVNPDIVGWIRIPDTHIDYPVLQGKDNEYYLTHSVNNEVIRNASLFADCRNHIKNLDFNTIIYGHNMHDGTMFGNLRKYKQEDFFLEHQDIFFDTAYTQGRWEVFSVYITDTRFDYLKTGFKKSKDCQAFIDEIIKKSLFKKETAVTPEDHILTLSTCTYEFKDARLVVHAKLIK